MATTRIIPMHVNKGKTIAQCLTERTDYAKNPDKTEDGEELQPAIAEDRDLGIMLYDMDFSNPKDIQPMFYRPKMQQGIITVPNYDSEEVMK